MAQEEQLRIMDKINHFERDPKVALLIEIDKNLDDEKRGSFEEPREQVLPNSVKTVDEVLAEAEMLVNSEKKERIEHLRALFVDANPMDKEFLSLVELQKHEQAAQL